MAPAAVAGPESLALTSRHFGDGEAMPLENCAKNIGGDDRSPHLAWTPPPAGTAQLLLVVEDIDVPLSKPAVHCLALIDPAAGSLEPGALNGRQP
ncbi:MAG TPA: YbhB/YbcL family Raf kinase inhibitor-like protein, partial [Amycolatopsis sp.]